MLLYNAKVFVNGRLSDGAVGFDEEKGIITDVSSSCSGEGIDCNGMLLLPGAIDCHVHFREPGATHKENFSSGSAGALAGGVTTVLDMPNNSPAVDSIERLREKEKLVAAGARCDYSLYFGGGKNNSQQSSLAAREASVAALKIYMGSSTGDLLADSVESVYAHFLNWESTKPIAVHAEDEESIKLFGRIARENNDVRHNDARPPFAAPAALARALTIAAATKRRVHVAHSTTAAEVELVKIAKERGVEATLEVCPHHLFLTDADQERLGALGKMNPPLRSGSDVAALWQAVNNGGVDIIATDHAPHTMEEKNKGFFDAPSGVPGVQAMMPLLLQAMEENKVTLEKIIELTSANPAKIFGLKEKGSIAVGNHADFSLWKKEEWVIRGEEMESKCKWTPFEGKKVSWKVEKVFLRGSVAFDGGVVALPGGGRAVAL